MKLTRRRFMQATMAAGAGHGLAAMLPGQAVAAPSQFYKAFEPAPAAGFDTASVELVSGQVPAGLEGTYYLNGPARHALGGVRYSHWFDGDGMVHAFRLDGGRLSHRGRYVETPKYLAEQEAGRYLYPAFGTLPPDSAAMTGPDSMNAANISVLAAGDRLLALWEGGSAFALDPASLETQGPVVLGEGLAGVPFSAHPRISPDGTIWNFGHDAMGGRLLLYQLSADGALQRFRLLSDMPRGMIHDFVATERHLVFGFPPFTAGGTGGGAYVDHFAWDGMAARHYVVVSKADLAVVRRYELPAAFQFHHFNAHEARDGTIRFNVCRYDDAAIVTTHTRRVMDGIPIPDAGQARIEHVTLYPDGRAEAELTGLRGEFPVVHPGRTESRAMTWCVGRPDGAIRGEGLLALDASGGVAAAWAAGPDIYPGEHVVVPGADGSNWLIGSQFDAGRGQSLIGLFAAHAVDEGPVALWRLPGVIPMPLHGTWVPAADR